MTNTVIKEDLVKLAAQLKEGDQLTLVGYGDFLMLSMQYVTVVSAEIEPYAQHKETLLLTGISDSNGKTYVKRFVPGQRFVVWNEWIEFTKEKMDFIKDNGLFNGGNFTVFSLEPLYKLMELTPSSPLFTSGFYTNADVEVQKNEDFLYELSTASGTSYFSYDEVLSSFEIKGFHRNTRNRIELQNQPLICGISPMWGGMKNGKKTIRYESNKTLDELLQVKAS